MCYFPPPLSCSKVPLKFLLPRSKRNEKKKKYLGNGISSQKSLHLGFLNFYRRLYILPQETLKDTKIVFLIWFLILNLHFHWRWSCNFSHQTYVAPVLQVTKPTSCSKMLADKANFKKKDLCLWAWCVSHDSVTRWSLGHLFFTYFFISVFKAFHSRGLTDVSITLFPSLPRTPSSLGKSTPLAIWMSNFLLF